MTAEFRETLLAAWRDLSVDRDDGALGEELLDAWSEPHRNYHDLAHLWHVLRRVAEIAEHAADLDVVRFAAWFHDAVHDGGPDDEERSAAWAERALDAAGYPEDFVAEVARLVRLTISHNPAPGDRNGEVLCDSDLAILASDEAAYGRYAASIRSEYAHVPDDAFRTGRAAVLRDLLALPSLFRTPHGRAHWEAAARANLAAELSALFGETR
ncbi:MAG: HD domain-containing protein [Sporichthyaceae bacterium]